MKAKLIGENSAGMTAVEIYNDAGDLVWSHRWFDNGSTHTGYIEGLCEAADCMRQCADVAIFDGGEIDDDGDPVPLDIDSTTGIMLEYDSETGWSMGDAGRSLGQSDEIIDALMLAGLLDPDDDHDDYADNDIVHSIAKHLTDDAGA